MFFDYIGNYSYFKFSTGFAIAASHVCYETAGKANPNAGSNQRKYALDEDGFTGKVYNPFSWNTW